MRARIYPYRFDQYLMEVEEGELGAVAWLAEIPELKVDAGNRKAAEKKLEQAFRHFCAKLEHGPMPAAFAEPLKRAAQAMVSSGIFTIETGEDWRYWEAIKFEEAQRELRFQEMNQERRSRI